MDLKDKVKAAGVVGAGGAGFPTHVKLESRVEYYLANGAECEPLLAKDNELMKRETENILIGLNLAADYVGAEKRHVAFKEKHKDAVGKFNRFCPKYKIGLSLLGDFYPAGDEYEIVYHITGRLIPPEGLPLQIGCIVNNVETLRNIKNAVDGTPVTTKYVTIAGAVRNPMTVEVPLGTSFRDLIDAAGGVSFNDDEPAILDGGAMMGKVLTDFDKPIVKTSAGFIVLPKSNRLIYRKSMPKRQSDRIGKSACDQCTYCTEFCPRYLLGYAIEPHKVMRSLGFEGEKRDLFSKHALLCSGCNLCSLYACPEELEPRDACINSKIALQNKGVKWEQTTPVKVHPMKEHRRVPTSKLQTKLGLDRYAHPAPFTEIDFKPRTVTIPLKQHIGVQCEPTVDIGAHVSEGDMIGDVPSGKLGAPVHSSVNGRVVNIDDSITIEVK
jgi:Na+-translocating ferredoxin:NAD+ oxidoreductase RnfC subunit